MIDALLFVFGYRAQKIRSKKISVLIHNSEQHSGLDCCCVEVYFQKIVDKVRLAEATNQSIDYKYAIFWFLFMIFR